MPMHILTTIGLDNATKAVAMFAMQEATDLGAPSHAELSEPQAPPPLPRW